MHLPRLSQTISSKSKKAEIWGCVRAEASVYYSSRRNAHPKLRAFSSGGERFPDTEEVTSSNLVTPTKLPRPEPSGSGLFWYVGAMRGDSVSGPILHLVGTSTSGPVLAHSGAVRTSRSSRKVGQMRSGRSRTKGSLYARWPTRHIGWRRRCSLGHCDPPGRLSTRATPSSAPLGYCRRQKTCSGALMPYPPPIREGLAFSVGPASSNRPLSFFSSRVFVA